MDTQRYEKKIGLTKDSFSVFIFLPLKCAVTSQTKGFAGGHG